MKDLALAIIGILSFLAGLLVSSAFWYAKGRK